MILNNMKLEMQRRCLRESAQTSSFPRIRDFFVDLIFTALDFLPFDSSEDVMLEDALCDPLKKSMYSGGKFVGDDFKR